jgi:hypothetical protein
VRIWRFRPGRGGSGWVGVGRVLLKTGQNLCGTSSPEPQNLQNLPEPRQNLARTLTEPPRQNLRTSERDPRRFWRFWRGLGEVFGGSEVLGQNLRFCIQNLVLVLYGFFALFETVQSQKSGLRRVPRLKTQDSLLQTAPRLKTHDSHLRTAPRLKTHCPVQAQDSRLKTHAKA